ncbi:MAG: hypothetical protein JWQ74_2220 [Marmoricola sp.]|nr:hypothetical protein [Marmoricola sp.]
MSVHRSLARFVALPAAVVGLSALAAAPALAHVSISPQEGAAGSYTVATVSVPHGCDGSATTKVTIAVPDQIIEVTPTRNALWDVTKTTKKLDTPIKAEDGDEITEKVDTVVYTAKTPLPDGYRDAFELSFQVPDSVGTTLAFPTIQKCVKGETAWTETTTEGADEPEHPAPTIKVTAATGEDGHHASSTDESTETTGTTGASATLKHDEADSAGASKGLAYTGLGVGILGLLAGAAALAKSRKA